MKKLDDMIKVLSNLKGIGKKNATRIAFDLLKKDDEYIEIFLNTIKDAFSTIKPCSICHNLTDDKICDICQDNKRNREIICVVEDTKDIYALNKSSMFNGLYHVLGAKLDPLNGIGVSDLNISSLIDRIDENTKEIILALNPDLEGETTILYLTKILSSKNVKISRLASGIPIGGYIEYSDNATLMHSLEGRIVIEGGK